MIVQDLDHERGDFSEYSNGKVDASSRMSVTTAAAAIGKYGVACQLVDDGTKYYADHDFLWLDVSDWRFRVYVKLDDVSMASGDRFRLVHMTGGSGSSLYVFIGYSSSIGHYVRTFTYYDGGSYVVSSDVPLASTGWNRIECVIQRATSSVASDGRAAIEIDGVQKWEQTGLDIYDRLPADNIQVGVPRADLEPGTSGTIYFDGIAISNGSSVAIGDELGGVIWAQVDAANRNCRDMRNENSLFDNTVFGWSSTWASGGASFKLDVVPKGATIHSAYMVVRSKTADGAFTADIYGEDVDSGSLFDTALTSFTRTTASVAWSGNFDAANKLFDTPDISSVVSEVTSRAGWAAGNNITFEIDGTSSSAVNPFSYTDSATWPARLRVVYSEPTTSDYPVTLSVPRTESSAHGATSASSAITNVQSVVGVSDTPKSSSTVDSGDIGILASVSITPSLACIADIAVTRSESQNNSVIVTSDTALPVAINVSSSVYSTVSARASALYQLNKGMGNSASVSVSPSVSLSALLSIVESSVSALSVSTSARTTRGASISQSSNIVAALVASVLSAVATSATTQENKEVSVSVSALMNMDESFIIDSVTSASLDATLGVNSGATTNIQQSIELISTLVSSTGASSMLDSHITLSPLYSFSSEASKGVMLSVDIAKQSILALSSISWIDVDTAVKMSAVVAAAVSSMISLGLTVQRVSAITVDKYESVAAMLIDVIASDSSVYTIVVTDSGASTLVMTDEDAGVSASDTSSDATMSDAGPTIVTDNFNSGGNTA